MGPINWPWLCAGLVIGSCLGWFLLALCFVASRPDRPGNKTIDSDRRPGE